MYLDAYYKMQFFERCVKNSSNGTSGYIEVPEIGLCDDTTATTYFRGYHSCGVTSSNESNMFFGERACFSKPTASMVSQTKTLHYESSNIIVGNGTTPSTPLDCKMESEIVDELACATVTKRTDITGGLIEFAKTMENISDQEITVSEIGLSWPYSNAYRGYYFPQVLVYREVLPEPIVVAPGESFTVKIKHEFAMP